MTKIPFEKVAISRRFEFKKTVYIKYNNNRGIDSHGYSEYVSKDRMVELIDTCHHCKYYEGEKKNDYIDYCKIIKDIICKEDDNPKPYSERQNAATFSCANFSPKEKE